MLKSIATACAGLFAGAGIYISLVQHPALLATDGHMAARFFPPMYRRGAIMQASLALVGTLAALSCWLSGSHVCWLVGALFLGFVVPFTLGVVKPVNDRLLNPALCPEDPEIPDLLERWGRLHWVRTVSSSVAFALFLWGQSAP